MKREIKFRMFHDKHMSYNPSFKGVEHQFEDIFSFGEWMQYTGIKDKNGKEIYEGDVATMVNSDHYMKGLLFKVHWLDCSFWMSDINGESETWSPSFFEWEIIGNIHENPELL